MKQKLFKNKNQRKANFSEEQGNINIFFAHNKFEVVDDQIWYLDSGFSNNMTSNKNLFFQLEENVKGQVKFGENN